MKVLSVSYSDLEGGAARAAYRLHHALLKEGIDSQMLVQKKSSDEYTIVGPTSNLQNAFVALGASVDLLPTKWYKNRTLTKFSTAWRSSGKIINMINAIDPDIVHLHWINGGMLSIKDLSKIKAPVVWSMHDMWTFTGGCHYSENCSAFTGECGNCKVLGSTKAYDLSRWVYNRKATFFSKMPETVFIGMSRWMSEAAISSSLLRDKKVVTLPNPIDSHTYAPVDKLQACQLLQLPQDKKLVLFGAIRATDDPRKGYTELQEAINKLMCDNAELIIFGSSTPLSEHQMKYPTHYLGHFHDDVSLRLLYSAADVMVVPSQQEAFGQMASEAMACGTPVVAFGHTGLLDIVEHQVNGYLARPLDTQDLANGIEWVLNAENYDELCLNARNKVLKEFDSHIVAQKYIELYKMTIQNKADLLKEHERGQG